MVCAIGPVLRSAETADHKMDIKIWGDAAPASRNRWLTASRFPEDRHPLPLLASPVAQALSLLLVAVVSGMSLKRQQLSMVSDSLAAVYPFSASTQFVGLRAIEILFYFVLNASVVSLALRIEFFRACARLGETYWIWRLPTRSDRWPDFGFTRRCWPSSICAPSWDTPTVHDC